MKKVDKKYKNKLSKKSFLHLNGTYFGTPCISKTVIVKKLTYFYINLHLFLGSQTSESIVDRSSQSGGVFQVPNRRQIKTVLSIHS